MKLWTISAAFVTKATEIVHNFIVVIWGFGSHRLGISSGCLWEIQCVFSPVFSCQSVYTDIIFKWEETWKNLIINNLHLISCFSNSLSKGLMEIHTVYRTICCFVCIIFVNEWIFLFKVKSTFIIWSCNWLPDSFCLKVHLIPLTTIPAGTQHQNDVVSTSMRRDHVASTLIRRHFNVVCPLG